MGAVIMLGTLFGLIVLIYALVLHFDPEARRPTAPDATETAESAERASR
jgi:hypothetical protein